MRKCKWSDNDVLYWAIKYLLVPDRTLINMENDLHVSHSTTWWCFNNRLKDINIGIYDNVQQKLKRMYKK